MYKVGEKVETPQFTGTIEKVYESGVKVNGKMFPLKDIKPYRTAHEKLIEIGWKLMYREDDGEETVYFNDVTKTYIEINEVKKTLGVREYGVSLTFEMFDLTLSRILTQYLEELEAKE